MLFMITQTHRPETCPKGSGRATTHIDNDIDIDIDGPNIAMKGCWEASTHHALWYLVEAENYQAVHHLLEPGIKEPPPRWSRWRSCFFGGLSN